MVVAILRAPVLFFDSNPVGRILNRFSNDIGCTARELKRLESISRSPVYVGDIDSVRGARANKCTGYAGLALVYVIQTLTTTQYAVRKTSEVENYMTDRPPTSSTRYLGSQPKSCSF
ncbi:hypothetical protein pdam_00024049 [Pocillopora damicornis]|uniref:ABC transmembrane type-1 domain-containing protein n=1 Tax=Pocillopora damicornis TaxID=46731 RepID=A0A3M6T8C7_POCDA|nr:hypothetical protein pdam_00024049 [Pocillopora damicornis]